MKSPPHILRFNGVFLYFLISHVFKQFCHPTFVSNLSDSSCFFLISHKLLLPSVYVMLLLLLAYYIMNFLLLVCSLLYFFIIFVRLFVIIFSLTLSTV